MPLVDPHCLLTPCILCIVIEFCLLCSIACVAWLFNVTQYLLFWPIFVVTLVCYSLFLCTSQLLLNYKSVSQHPVIYFIIKFFNINLGCIISVTALHTCMCMLACLLGLTTYRKFYQIFHEDRCEACEASGELLSSAVLGTRSEDDWSWSTCGTDLCFYWRRQVTHRRWLTGSLDGSSFR